MRGRGALSLQAHSWDSQLGKDGPAGITHAWRTGRRVRPAAPLRLRVGRTIWPRLRVGTGVRGTCRPAGGI